MTNSRGVVEITTGKNRRKLPNKRPAGNKFDHKILFDIKKYLRKKHGIKASRILIDHTMKSTQTGFVILGKLSYLKISNIAKRNLVHTPDIIVTDGDTNPVLIIEHDGKIHESDKVSERDKKRNRNYTKAGIEFIIINTTKLKKAKKTWKEYLDEKMNDLDI